MGLKLKARPHRQRTDRGERGLKLVGNGESKLDAGESAFFLRELEYIQSRVYYRKYARFLARDLFPINFEGGAGIDSITYRMISHIGLAKVVANYATDSPRVDLYGEEFTAKVRELSAHYGYSIKEIRRAIQAGISLDAEKATAVRRAFFATEDQIAFQGDSNHGLQGLMTHPNTNTITLANDGTGSVTTWSAKTSDQLVRDMNQIVNKASEVTNDVEESSVLCLPVAQFNQVSSQRMGSTNDVSVLAYFLKNSPYCKEVRKVPQLKLLASSGTLDVAMAYRKDPEAIELLVPSEFEQLPVQEEGLEFLVYCLESFAGLRIRYPLSVSIATGC